MATFEVDVCAGLEASGHTVHYSSPEAMPILAKDVRRVGAYIGAYHTPSLQQAQSTIFLCNDGESPVNVIALHVKQSPMIVYQRMMSARAGMKNSAEAIATAAIAKAKAPSVAPKTPLAAAAPAPVLKPRLPVTSGAGSGGF